MAGMTFQQLMGIAQEAGGFEVLPAGKYISKVDSAEAVKSSGGKDMIKVQFAVTQGPKANQKIFNNYTLSPENPNAVAFFFRHMKAFGLDSEFFASEPQMSQVAQALVGRTVMLDVVIDNSYDGTDRNKVKNTLPAPPEYTSTGAPVAAPPVDPFAAQAAAPAPAPVAPPVAPSAPAAEAPVAQEAAPAPANALPAPPF